MDWFLKHKPHLARYLAVADCADPGIKGPYFIELVPKDRLMRLLAHVLDEAEFLSDHGVRSLSRYHYEHPFEIELGANISASATHLQKVTQDLLGVAVTGEVQSGSPSTSSLLTHWSAIIRSMANR